mmetsp:Transcript_51680/g.159279  ORF Transcript_51680/g.159279 Transcript_51680/m.159279 type:complete len:228 (-) Transcript_51680:195-878(-)
MLSGASFCRPSTSSALVTTLAMYCCACAVESRPPMPRIVPWSTMVAVVRQSANGSRMPVVSSASSSGVKSSGRGSTRTKMAQSALFSADSSLFTSTRFPAGVRSTPSTRGFTALSSAMTALTASSALATSAASTPSKASGVVMACILSSCDSASRAIFRSGTSGSKTRAPKAAIATPVVTPSGVSPSVASSSPMSCASARARYVLRMPMARVAARRRRPASGSMSDG